MIRTARRKPGDNDDARLLGKSREWQVVGVTNVGHADAADDDLQLGPGAGSRSGVRRWPSKSFPVSRLMKQLAGRSCDRRSRNCRGPTAIRPLINSSWLITLKS